MSMYSKIIDLQKLQESWKQVYKNKPKEGADGVACEEFEADKNKQIKELWQELTEHRYECIPVKLVPLYKGEKVRYVSLYSMRDKVVQYSITKELSKVYEPLFSDCCYAYRNGKSALHACQKIHERISGADACYILRADIKSFFDCICHDILLAKLRDNIKEEDVLNLIRRILTAPSVGKMGELLEKKVGVYQGSSIAPVLSNVYMMELDRQVEQEVEFYVRYSDDMVIFFSNFQRAEIYQRQLSAYLEKLGLTLNEEKTRIVSLEDGFEFLGYEFRDQGRSIPAKAKKQLSERLEAIWLNSECRTIQERLEKGAEILSGWHQYYSEPDSVGSVLEFAVWVFMSIKKGNIDSTKIQQFRSGLENPYKDVALYLADIWKKFDMKEWELYEYEQYFSLNGLDKDVPIDVEAPLQDELLAVFRKYMINEDERLQPELIQLYSDLKMYQKAEVLQEKTRQGQKSMDVVHLDQQELEEEAIVLSTKEMQQYMELFVGREDVYAVDGIVENHKRKVEEIQQPLLETVVEKHLTNREIVSTYIQRSNGTVKYLVFDLDISKGILLQYHEEALRREYMRKCLSLAREICKELRHMGLNGYLEQSGSRGYHVWLFFSEWLPVRYANLLSDIMEQKIHGFWKGDLEHAVQVEYFPNKTRLKSGKRGQCIKLPWGIHPKTGKRSYFLDEDGQYMIPQKAILKAVVRHSGNEVKRVLSAYNSNEILASETLEVEKDLQMFGAIDESVRAVLDSCNLLRYLSQKARKTHYLTHFERLTLLYVFGHLGEDGKNFIHKVMSFTLNYSYQVTQKFILKCPEKPISCLKLRDQYKQISAEIGCSCVFKRTRDCYPSPVLHALRKSEDDKQITMPVSRTLPENKRVQLKTELSITEKAQQITEKMLDLRKQKRSLEKLLCKCEQELDEIFDDAGTDSIEIKTGLLTRRKTENGEEWFIAL